MDHAESGKTVKELENRLTLPHFKEVRLLLLLVDSLTEAILVIAGGEAALRHYQQERKAQSLTAPVRYDPFEKQEA